MIRSAEAAVGISTMFSLCRHLSRSCETVAGRAEARTRVRTPLPPGAEIKTNPRSWSAFSSGTLCQACGVAGEVDRAVAVLGMKTQPDEFQCGERQRDI